MKKFTRRQVMIGALTASGLPYLHTAALAANPDVVVIGAGAAGLAATRQLMEKGKTVICIEAMNRIGGRAHTDHEIFGVPYDIGAHWLTHSRSNPFVDYAKKNDFDVYPEANDEILYVGNRQASDEEYDAYDTAMRDTYRAILKAGERGQDIAPAKVVRNTGEWTDTVHMRIGAYEMAKDFDHFSCADWYSGAESSDWFCRQGFGTLVAHRAQNLPVQLNTTLSKVKWGGAGVTLQTDHGTISAKAVIITVSTGVLAAEKIKFDPPLPVKKQEAFNGITMGLYNHIALQFSDNFFGIGADGYVSYQLDNQNAAAPRGIGLLTNISGTNLTFADVGGGFAKQLEAAGPDTAIDFALGELRNIFGSRVDSSLIKAHVTNWGQNMFTLGSYASAKPGAFNLRNALRQSVADRVFFAGEATSRSQWATVVGAHKTGLATAKIVSNKI